jgi:hypothetical protein
MNAYCSIADIKNALAITATTDDVILRKTAEAAARIIDRFCGRPFYVKSETRYFDGAGARLWIDDLLSVTTLKTDEDGDATFENTYATTDYNLYPLNKYPKYHIDLSEASDYGGFGAGSKSVEIVGAWGYGDGISATPYLIDTTTNEALDASEVGVDVTAVTNLSPGQTILVESEQMFIESIATTTLTVIRGVNGTTKATHDTAKSIYIYQYPYDVWQAAMALSSAIYQNRNKAGIQSERLGDYSYSLDKAQTNTICNEYLTDYKIKRVS